MTSSVPGRKEKKKRRDSTIIDAFGYDMTSFEINLSLDELLSIKSRQAIKFVIKIPFSIAVTTNFPVHTIWSRSSDF